VEKRNDEIAATCCAHHWLDACSMSGLRRFFDGVNALRCCLGKSCKEKSRDMRGWGERDAGRETSMSSLSIKMPRNTSSTLPASIKGLRSITFRTRPLACWTFLSNPTASSSLRSSSAGVMAKSGACVLSPSLRMKFLMTAHDPQQLATFRQLMHTRLHSEFRANSMCLPSALEQESTTRRGTYHQRSAQAWQERPVWSPTR